MPLEETDIIDMITAPNSEGLHGLIITDAGITTEPSERLRLFEQKLNAYHRAIAKNLLVDSCPDTTPADFYIQVLCQNRPSKAMRSITHLLIQTEERVKVPIIFSEFPEGSWTEETADDKDSSTLSEEMQGAVETAFSAAAEWLAKDSIPLFVYWLDSDEPKLAAINEAKDHESVIARVTAWASKLGNEAWIFILMTAGKTTDNALPADVLVAYCCERGEKDGFVLMREIQKNPDTGKLETNGPIQYAETCANFFPYD